MDWEVITSYIPLYKEAMFLTLRIGWLGILLSIVIGVLCALVLHHRIPVLRVFVTAYVEVFRNTPLLVQLFFIYFALPKVGFVISAEACGVVGLALLGGAYMCEGFRSGIEAVDPMQMKSALCLGMTKSMANIYIVLPQAFAIGTPAFVGNIIFLLKETSVFSAISLLDLMFTAKDLIGMYAKTVEALFMLVVFYLIILLPVSILGTLVERRLRRGGFGI